MDIRERDILIWLNSKGVSNKAIENLKNHFIDLRKILDLNKNISNYLNINNKSLKKIPNKIDKYEIYNYIDSLKEKNIDTITILDNNYPEKLKEIYNRPVVLYKKGNLIERDNLAIAIVGSRKTTAYGRWACEKFAKELTNLGITIISGIALGIDTIAHKTSIENGGRTLGIIGNGLDVIYPKSNKKLYGEIMNNGAVITEFPLNTLPLSYNFPQRNRIISGLSCGIIIVEAKEKSGSLITAHHGLEQGRDIFSIPGNINSIYSKGTNKLIKDGAIPLLDIDDILNEIYEFKIMKENEKEEDILNTDLSETERAIIKIIKEGPTHCDTIVNRTGIDISTITSMLTILEIKGLIIESTSRTFMMS